MNVTVRDNQVITLETLARRFSEWFGVEASANKEADRIDFKTKDGEDAYVDSSGFAYVKAENGVRILRDYECDWTGSLEVPDVVWAHDADGVLVALVN